MKQNELQFQRQRAPGVWERGRKKTQNPTAVGGWIEPERKKAFAAPRRIVDREQLILQHVAGNPRAFKKNKGEVKSNPPQEVFDKGESFSRT